MAITDTNWTIPENIGYPINTSGDDRYYVVSANGERGYYSSAKNGGYGEHDIYIVHLGAQAKQHHLVLIKGEVTANDKFAEAEISVEYVKNNMPYEGYFKSNSATGKYIVILPGNNNYNLTFKVPGFKPHIENVNASDISTYKEIIRDIKLYSDDYVRTLSISSKLMIGETFAKPASGVTVFITNKDASVSLQTTTDNEGNFSFDNVPSGFGYTFSLAGDANIFKAMLTGTVSSGGTPKPGIHFAVSGGNETDSKEDGSFKLEILPAPPKECDFPVQYLLPYTGGKTAPDFSDEIYRKIINKYGGCIAEGLIFKVQIGAYFTPENFNYSYFNELGNVTTQLLKDGITRFVMGKYKRLNEADNLRNKAVKIGDKDAFIVIYYNGERMKMSEAIAKEF